MVMADYYRPSINKKEKEMVDDFLERYPDLPFTDAKDLMLFATKRYMDRVENEEEIIDRQKQELENLVEQLKDPER